MTKTKIINSKEFRELVDDYSIHQLLAYDYCEGTLTKSQASKVILKKAWEIVKASKGRKQFKDVLKKEWAFYTRRMNIVLAKSA